MKHFIIKRSYDLPDFDYFKYELGWNVDSIDDVLDLIEMYTDKERFELLGRYKEECSIEEVSNS